MNKQTESFLNALKDIEEGKIVELDKALNEEPPSEELQKIYNDIDRLDGEREAWKRMFDLQTKLVMGLELDKINLEKESKSHLEQLQKWKQMYRTLWKRHLMLEKLNELNMNDFHEVVDQRDWYYDRYRFLKEQLNVT